MIMLMEALAAVGALALCSRALAPRPAPPAPREHEKRAGERSPREELSWELDVLDVGTGLSLLLRGADFSLLYDGGSNDDRATGPHNRVLAYLHEALGAS